MKLNSYFVFTKNKYILLEKFLCFIYIYFLFSASSLIHNNPPKDAGGPTHIPTLRVAHHGSAKQTTQLPYIVVNPTTSKPFISSTSPAKYLVNPTTTVSTLRPVLKREQPRRSELVYPIPPIPTFDPKSLFDGKFKLHEF